jgi:mRNA-degrading endonuclease RelE of RelBE toxin-antitoxin system
MKYKAIVTQTFMNDFINLSKKEQKQVIKTLNLMEKDIKYPSLNCHSVKGTPYHKVYVNMDRRLIFEKTNEMYVLFKVGHHDILDKL